MRAKNIFSILLVTTLFLSCIDASAQNYHRGMKYRRHFRNHSESGKIYLGPIAGVNMAIVVGDGAYNNAMKLGFHGGALADFGAANYLIVEAGILYSVKGTQNDTMSSAKLNMNYLEMPLNAKVKLDNGIYFFAGPYFGLLMSAKATDGTNSADAKKFFSDFDFGFNLGLGYQMKNGLGVNFHYGLGLANVNTNIEGRPDTPSNTNTALQLSLIYFFPLN
jgi:hypothetical protein